MSEDQNESANRLAVGLKYDPEVAAAPQIVAKGEGSLAERLLHIARESEVPVRRDPDLCELLSVSEIGDEIPAQVYSAVAQLISFLWTLNAEDSSGCFEGV